MRTCDWCNGTGKPTKEGDPGDQSGRWCSRCLGIGNISGPIVVQFPEDDHVIDYVGPFETMDKAQEWLETNKELIDTYAVGTTEEVSISVWVPQNPEAYLGWLREMKEEDEEVAAHTGQ